jgi:hypothetical protein
MLYGDIDQEINTSDGPRESPHLDSNCGAMTRYITPPTKDMDISAVSHHGGLERAMYCLQQQTRGHPCVFRGETLQTRYRSYEPWERFASQPEG